MGTPKDDPDAIWKDIPASFRQLCWPDWAWEQMPPTIRRIAAREQGVDIPDDKAYTIIHYAVSIHHPVSKTVDDFSFCSELFIEGDGREPRHLTVGEEFTLHGELVVALNVKKEGDDRDDESGLPVTHFQVRIGLPGERV
ncbi:hypothetical protein [Streptomyces sp. 5-10]|uniref:hypothetical protein n=1 Tax=Streptomyces sp. 5-10 TaxID=878925 RepID=UPI00168A45DB|nr:hypothetical protein [Streptomyces sp. 5-10]MBD3004713.1 hypothetical protein [Streptomyces sp. 5-10]